MFTQDDTLSTVLMIQAERRAPALPVWAWSAVEKIQWRDQTEQEAQRAWFGSQPSGGQRPQGFAGCGIGKRANGCGDTCL